MPTFYVDEIDIEAHEYISSCSSSEIRELILELINREYLPPNVKYMISDNKKKKPGFHPTEEIYENALEKLHGKYSNLTQEEEEMILKISNRL